MKIGYFISYFPYKDCLDDTDYFRQYHHGGAEIAAYYLAINMAQGGHEIDVFTTSINSKDSFEKHKGVNIHRYGTSFKIEKGNLSFKLFQKPLDLELDIVHAHFSTPPAELAALKYAKRKKVPFILTYHGDGQEGFGGVVRRMTMSFYNKYLLDKVLSSSDVIISPSKYYINESRFLGK
ncbi:glycosyltransferase, partial [candidate division WOR-3 bacterium]|nr:glycosyltransferase [candidate division WOR-3 bacterium]